MIEIPLKAPGYICMRYLSWLKLLPLNLTVSVTYKCNSRCYTCNIWRKEEVNELSTDEFHQTFKSIGRTPYWITVSGGEPFLRGDIANVVDCMCEEIRPRIVNIPTNGLVFKTAEKVREIAEEHPKTHFIVNLSLDGVGSRHDGIRGVPGSFEKAMKTFRELKMLSSENLDVGIHTVISKYNVKELPELYDYVEKLNPSSYIAEIAERRVELGTWESDIAPDIKDYEEAVLFLKKKIREDKSSGIPKLIRTLRSEYYDLTLKTLKERRQVIPCYAGYCSAQITPDGYVWPCCVKAYNMGNLRDVDYNFKKIWFGAKADEIRRSIKNKECYCPLANASYTNMLCNPESLIKILFKVVLA